MSLPPRVRSELGTQKENINRMGHTLYMDNGVGSALLPSQLPAKTPGFYEPWGRDMACSSPLPLGSANKHLYPVGLAEGLLGVEERVEGL